MLASPDYLLIVAELAKKDLFRNLKTGAHVIRGYADLGYEEFILVGPGKLVSLYTGTQSSLPEEHKHFFSTVPTTEELTNEILKNNFDIVEVTFKDQRVWSISAKHIENGYELSVEHSEFECTLALLLKNILETA